MEVSGLFRKTREMRSGRKGYWRFMPFQALIMLGRWSNYTSRRGHNFTLGYVWGPVNSSCPSIEAAMASVSPEDCHRANCQGIYSPGDQNNLLGLSVEANTYLDNFTCEKKGR